MSMIRALRVGFVVVLLSTKSVFAETPVNDLGRPSVSAVNRSAPDCYVLAIGINKYKYMPNRELRGAVKDAEAVADLFREQDPRVIVKSLLNEAATGAAISQALDDINSKAHSGDRVIVYISSHGARYGNRFHFIPHDDAGASISDGRKPNSARDSLNVDFFNMKLDLLTRGKEVILIIDACHAGQVLVNVSRSLARKADGGMVLLASSAAGQASMDGANHGRFTAALLEALEGRADEAGDADGKVSLKELRRYLFTRMKDLEADPRRLPGMPFSEQDFVCDASYSMPETLTLSRPRKKGPVIEPVKWAEAPEPKFKYAAAVAPGTWQIVEILKDGKGKVLVGNDGKPLQQKFVLDFRSDGNFTSIFDGPLGSQVAVGKWEKSAEKPYDIDMVFDGGVDSFRIEAMIGDSLVARVYPHSKKYEKVGIVFDPRNEKGLGTWSLSYKLHFDPRSPPITYKFDRVKAVK